MNSKPVIFLAFANDKVDNTTYLRNLSAEMHGIRKALAEAVSSGLCELVERSSASVADILDVFQDPVYASRISIFHYGGHANGFSLLLESEDGSKVLTHKDGLVPFLARQENLKLIFLNGCSSEGQAADLLTAGIPAVIGTTTSINDEIATSLAIRFYSSLGDGSGIEKAWTNAIDEVKINKGTGNTRALYWEGKKEIGDHFPWVIQFRPGADIIKAWNLPDISGNPLYALPDIPATYNLPESPFLYLNRYERRHAEVFFGRSYYIRALFSSVNDHQAPPIILLYGQSGVGKSSLLEAGLQPRLESKFEMVYLRRLGAIGLSATVYNALLEKCGFIPEVRSISGATPNVSERVLDDLRNIADKIEDTYKSAIHQLIEKMTRPVTTGPETINEQSVPPKTISQAWKMAEDKLKKPLVIILDQLEEAYTRPNESLGNEMNQFFIELKNIFKNPSTIPKGKIILSFRKEYHPEIDEYCKNYELPRSQVFIEHITRKDVLELFKGLIESPRLKSRYNLQAEDGLPEIVAADIAADKDSPIAPMLQILLTKMWIKAISINSVAPSFTHEIYRHLKMEGLAMDEFLQNQLEGIRLKSAPHYQAGFIVDVLNYYCTPNNTAASRTNEQLRQHYSNAKEEAAQVLQLCKDQFLIIDLGGADQNAMLAHDTLAKSVSKLFQRSTLPLQQARRVLSSRMEAVRGGSTNSTLDFWDLRLIDGVKKYMPTWTEEEHNLVELSRKAVSKKEKDKKILGYVKQALVAITLLGAILISILYKQSKKNALESSVNHLAAASASQLSRDPTQSLLYAAQGMKMEQGGTNIEIKKSLTHAFYRALNSHNPWYNIIINGDLNYTDLLVNENTGRIIPYTEASTLSIYDFEGHEKGKIFIDQLESPVNKMEDTTSLFYNYFVVVQWSRDGQTIITLNSAGIIHIYSADGVLKNQLGDAGEFNSLDVSKVTDEFIAFNVTDQSLHTFDLNGNLTHRIETGSDVAQICYTADAKNILVTKDIYAEENTDQQGSIDQVKRTKNNELEFISTTGERHYLRGANEGAIERVTHSPGGQFIATQHINNAVVLWDTKGKIVQKIKLPYVSLDPLLLEIVWIEFHPTDQYLAICYRDHKAYLYATGKVRPPVIFDHEHLVTFINFSKDGQRILTGAADNKAVVWDLSGKRLFTLLGHQSDVTGGKILENNKVITTSLDGTVRSWQLENYEDIVLRGHVGRVNYLDVDPLEKYLVSAGIDDHTLRLWDLDSRREVHSISLGDLGVRYVQFLNEDEVLGITDVNEAFLYKLFEDKPIMLNGHTGPIEWAEVLLDHIVTASRDGTIRFWNKNGKQEHEINEHSGALLSLRISEKDSLVAVGSDSGRIFLYNQLGVSQGELTGHKGSVNYLDVSKDGLHMVSASNDRTGIIWNLKSKKLEGNLDRIACAPYNVDCHVISANFSYGGSQVVTTSSDRMVRVWALNGDLISQMAGHTDNLVDAFFSPNDQMVYSFSADHTLRLWDPTGKEIVTYGGHTGKINMAYVDQKINHIYTASDDGTIRIWLTPAGVYQWMQHSDQFKSKSNNQ